MSENLTPLKRSLIALRELKSKLDALEQAKTEPIAIIGMSCRFSGGADNPDLFWQMLIRGESGITEIPADRWDVDSYYDPDPEAPGKMYTRWGGFLDPVDRFDAAFFGLSPRETASMDPQQRFLLETSWEALENAGLAPDRLTGSRTGVYVGISTNDYGTLQFLTGGLEQVDTYMGTGNLFSVAAGRIAYLLGLNGPTMVVDTACSSSLVALHYACQDLRLRKSDMALAAGVGLILTPAGTIQLSKAGALSPNNRCKTFDKDADGYVRGEGCGVVVLKRLSDALADGDMVLALIRGSAVNHDGRSSGLTVPNGQAQKAVIEAALQDAGGLDPHLVGYIEAHGTGTSLGDPIELRALHSALCKDRPRSRPLFVGSVKTNIGHLEAAAGIAGLIKTVLALQHKQIPPHLHLRTPTPHFDWENSPIRIPTEKMPWPEIEGRRIAGLSSFGLSGTNAHIIIEAAPEPQPPPASEVERPAHLLALSAKNAAALSELVERYRRYLDENPEAALADIAFSANTGRSHFSHRAYLVAGTREDLKSKLEELQKTEAGGSLVPAEKPKIAFLFTGQGAQYAGMGRELYETQPTFRAALDRCDELMQPHLGRSLLSLLYPAEGEETLIDDTRYTQPALFALGYALAQLWMSWGIKPAAVMGHSIGEYTAACIAGVFSLEDAVRLVVERGRLMGSLPPGGAMAAVFTARDRLEASLQSYTGQVDIAAVNGPENFVISGEGAAVKAICDALAREGVKSHPLNVSHAFHSPLMDPVLQPFKEAAASVTFSRPKIRLISNRSGKVVQGDELSDPAYWAAHIRQPVQFHPSILSLQQIGCRVFLELGPKPTLIAMAQQILPTGEALWLPSLSPRHSDWDQMLHSLGQLYLQGVDIDWAGFDRDYVRQRVRVPTYPFQRQRYWFQPSGAGSPQGIRLSRADAPVHPFLERRLPVALKDIIYESRIGTYTPSYLSSRRLFERPTLPESACVEAGLAAARDFFQSTDPLMLQDLTITGRLALEENGQALQVILSPQGPRRAALQIFAQANPAGSAQESWRLLCSARVSKARPDVHEDAFSPEEVQRRLTETCLEDWYEVRARRGLQIAGRLQPLQQLWLGSGEALARLNPLPDPPVYDLHPVWLDVALQLLVDSDISQTHLLKQIDQVTIYQRSAPAWCHAVISGVEGGSVQGELRLYDAGGSLIARLQGMQLQAVEAEEPLEKEADLSKWLYSYSWLEQPRDEQLEEAPASGSWLILADQQGVGRDLAALLTGLGQSVQLVYRRQPSPFSHNGEKTVDPLQRAELEEMLVSWQQDEKKTLQGIVYLWGLDAPPITDLTAQALEESQTWVTGGLLSLVQALSNTAAGWKSQPVPPRIWVVTRGAQPLSPEETVSLEQSALWGLGRTAALELPNLWGGLIDLDPAGSGEALQALAHQILHPDAEKQIALRGGLRYAARLLPAGEHLRTVEFPAFQPDAAYLITGGLGGLGLQAAQWMAEQGARHLVLLGRTPLPPRTDWQEAANNPRYAAAITALQHIESCGAEVLTAAVDVADEAQVNAFFQTYKAEGRPPILGVIHAAGLIQDSSLVLMETHALQVVLRPKVVGAWLLHQALRDTPLDFFVLYSTSAALTGSPGQANYTAANAFMDALAHYRRALGLAAQCINWGAWAEVGMAARTEKAGRRRSGLAQIPPRQGLKMLGRLLYQDITRIAVIPAEPAELKANFPADDPFLKELAGEIAPGETEPEAAQARVELLLQAAPEQRLEMLLGLLKQRAGQVLRMEPGEIPDDSSLMALGFDSIMIMELIRILDRDLQLTLFPREIFEQPSIQALGEYLLGEVMRVHQPVEPAAADADAGEIQISFSSAEAEKAFVTPQQRNPGIIFLLSSPRAGSTLLRVMLAGHPDLFSPPELHLLPFNTMKERTQKLAGSYLEEGLLRAVMALKDLDADQAGALIAEWVEQDLPVQEVYRLLQEWAYPRILVDKSPAYGMEMEVLERAEALFDSPRYIHLVRHPYAMIDSFLRVRMDRLLNTGGMDPARLAEHIWATTTGNTLDFLASLDPERSLLVKFEDLVSRPEEITQQVCAFLNLPFVPELLEPYSGERMTDGVHGASLSIGDPNFHKHQKIEARYAEAWRQARLPYRPGGAVRRIAAELGYEMPWPLQPAAEKKSSSRTPAAPPARPAKLPLSPGQQRLLFIDQFDPGEATYHIPLAMRLQGSLDHAALERSLNDIVLRHEPLHTNFVQEDGQWYQQIQPAPLTLRIIDLQHLPADRREAEARQQVLEEVRRPFDLTRDLKLRAALFRLEPEVHFLALTLHHIASDGWSLGVLLNELTTLYRGYVQGAQPQLDPLPLQYADDMLLQQQPEHVQEIEKQLAYWKKQLGENPPPPLDLTTGRPRPAVQTHRGDRLPVRLPASLTSSLKALSREEGVTLFMLLLAACHTLLHRYTGQKDITIGTPISGRNRPEITPLIGYFANTLVMRADLSDDPEFRAFLAQVRRVALEAYENQDIPFDRLVEELQPERDLSRSPLFQVMLVLQNTPMNVIELPGLTLSPLENIHTGTAKFDLMFSFTETGPELTGFIEYNTDLFPPETVERMAIHMQTLLESIVENPALPLSKLNLLSPQERHQILVEWNATDLEYPADRFAHELIAAQAQITPHAVAAVFEDQQLTYRELDERANQLAHYLQKLGAGPGTLIAICVERSLEMLVGVLGILKAGGAYVPLDPTYPRERLSYLLQDTRAPIILTQEKLTDRLPEHDARVVLIDAGWTEISQESCDPPACQIDADDPAYIIHTSGSTGQPKGVQIPHKALQHFIHAMRAQPGFSADDVLVAVITLSFDMSVFELFVPLTVGARVVIASSDTAADGVRLAKLLEDSGATVLQATPTTWQLLVHSGWQGSPQLRAVTGGEALTPHLADALLKRVKELWNLYGPTEITVYAAGCRVEAGDGPIHIGRPIANAQCYILDSNLQPVPVGVTGELYIGGKGLADGYLNKPELTAEKFIPHPFDPQPGARLYRTGDLARYLPDGNIEYLGRIDHQVKIRGFRVELGEIETRLRQHPAVQETVVVARQDSPGEKRLVGYVILKPGMSATVSELRQFLREQLPDYMLPSAFVFLDSFPLTANKKIDRKALPAPDQERPDLEVGFVAPRSPVEQELAQIWGTLLKLDRVGVQDNFFDLGGHSLLAAQVISRLNQAFRVNLPLRTIFDAATIAQLAEKVEAERIQAESTTHPTSPLDRDDALKLLEF